MLRLPLANYRIRRFRKEGEYQIIVFLERRHLRDKNIQTVQDEEASLFYKYAFSKSNNLNQILKDLRYDYLNFYERYKDRNVDGLELSFIVEKTYSKVILRMFGIVQERYLVTNKDGLLKLREPLEAQYTKRKTRWYTNKRRLEWVCQNAERMGAPFDERHTAFKLDKEQILKPID